jgi:hypothetical protein
VAPAAPRGDRVTTSRPSAVRCICVRGATR